MKKKGTVLFIPHGGGPLPILGDLRHQELIKFLEKIKTRINKPSSIIIVSAGKRGQAHFPAPKNLYLWKQQNIQTYITRKDGTITCSTDGRALTCGGYTAR